MPTTGTRRYDDNFDSRDHSEQWEDKRDFVKEVKNHRYASPAKGGRMPRRGSTGSTSLASGKDTPSAAAAARLTQKAIDASENGDYRESANYYMDAFTQFKVFDETWHYHRWQNFYGFCEVLRLGQVRPRENDMNLLERIKRNRKEGKLFRMYAADTRGFLIGNYFRDPYDAAEEYKYGLGLLEKVKDTMRTRKVMSLKPSSKTPGQNVLRLRFVGEILDEMVESMERALTDIEEQDDWQGDKNYHQRVYHKNHEGDRQQYRRASSRSPFRRRHSNSTSTDYRQQRNSSRSLGSESRSARSERRSRSPYPRRNSNPELRQQRRNSGRSLGSESKEDESFAPMHTETYSQIHRTKEEEDQDGIPQTNVPGYQCLSREQMDKLLSKPGLECDSCCQNLERIDARKIKRCTRCMMSYYCSDRCQKHASKVNKHRMFCCSQGLIKPGDFMQIHGVTSKPAWNGQIVKVIGYAPRGRFEVVRYTVPEVPIADLLSESISMSGTKLRRLRPLW